MLQRRRDGERSHVRNESGEYNRTAHAHDHEILSFANERDKRSRLSQVL